MDIATWPCQFLLPVKRTLLLSHVWLFKIFKAKVATEASTTTVCACIEVYSHIYTVIYNYICGYWLGYTIDVNDIWGSVALVGFLLSMKGLFG